MLNDIFEPGQLFDMATLTAYANREPFVPGAIGQLFTSSGIATTTAIIDQRDGVVELIEDRARGAEPQAMGSEGRNAVAVVTRHFPLLKTISPSDFQNIRTFGSDNELDTLETVRNRYIDGMNKSHALTLEHQRVEAVKGLITNAAGAPIDLYATFGETQSVVEMALGTASTKVRDRVLDAIEQAEEAMGAEMVNGFDVFCGKAFFRSLIEHSNVKSAYELFQNGSALRDDVRGGFDFGGATFRAYRGKINGQALIGDDEAYLVPRAEGLLVTRYAPAHFVETANTIGLPVTVKAELAPFGRGIGLLSESNPISFCTRPASIIKLVKNTLSA